MNNNKYIHSVNPNPSPKIYSRPTLNSRQLLENGLKKRGLEIRLKNSLKGGVISQVYDAQFNGKPVVVKHTENVTPFDPTEFFIGKKGHNIDSHVLKLLNKSKKVKVPKVLFHFPQITTTIMKDVRTDGFELMNNQLLNGKLLMSSAQKIGEALAYLGQEMRGWNEFNTNESAEQSIYERGLELRLAYPSSQTQYLELEKEFTSNNKYCVWPDGHPKNVFVDKRGDVIFIDFGRCVFADQKYMLPNFLAHIVIYTLARYINKQQSIEYIRACVSTYKKLEPVDEDLFCRYLAIEVLHRSYGKWIQGINTKEQKLALVRFGLNVFDKKIKSIEKLSNRL